MEKAGIELKWHKCLKVFWLHFKMDSPSLTVVWTRGAVPVHFCIVELTPKKTPKSRGMKRELG